MRPDATSPLRVEHFHHGGFSVEIILPRSSEALIDEHEFDADERLPYWAELWPSARALARMLLEEGHLPRQALELGCGVGLPSLAMRHRGLEVTASDYYADALEFVALNADHNQIRPPSTLLADWRNPPPHLGAFRLVVAADVLYEPRNADALATFLPRVVAPGGELVLADPGRLHLRPFLDRMGESEWQVVELAEREEPGPAGDGTRIRVKLFRLIRPADSG